MTWNFLQYFFSFKFSINFRTFFTIPCILNNAFEESISNILEFSKTVVNFIKHSWFLKLSETSTMFSQSEKFWKMLYFRKIQNYSGFFWAGYCSMPCDFYSNILLISKFSINWGRFFKMNIHDFLEFLRLFWNVYEFSGKSLLNFRRSKKS